MTQASNARWCILLLTCGGLFGQFYAYDNPSALNEQLREVMGVEEYQYYFNLIYSVYSFPNLVLPLVMGVLMDWFGYRALVCVLAACVVLGHALVSTGVTQASWPLVIAGRVLFGVGGESIQVAQCCLLLRWFKGKEVAFALGVNLSFARGGSVINDILSPWIASRYGAGDAFWFGTLLCFGSCASNILSVALDLIHGEAIGLPEAPTNAESGLLGALSLRRQFWYLCGLCVFLYSAILPFNNIASAFFVETAFADLPLLEAQQRAGNVMSILFLAAALGTPVFGLVIDNVGMRSQCLVGCSAVLTVTYVSMASAPPAFSMFCLGMVFMVFAGALWPAIALVVAEKQLGTAYGVATAAQNGGLAFTPLVVGYLQANSAPGDFTEILTLFTLCGVVGGGFAVLIWHTNQETNGVLDLPSDQAAEMAALMLAEDDEAAAMLSAGKIKKDIAAYL